MSSTYPADEFEHPGEDLPVGAHRQPPSRWRPVIPFLVILVVVPLLAWGVSYLLQRRDAGDDAAQSAPPAVTQQSGQSDARPTPSPTPTPTQPSAAPTAPDETKPEEEENPELGIDYALTIEVLNATDISGYAGQIAADLEAAGFTSVIADNTSGWITEVNTVFFTSAEQEATAHQVASIAGIDSVVLDPDATGGEGIVVLLVE
ncbi:LytR C-terminal domain-containing protein [Scrofimicrobium sp. R131]|uniref:LytR C-terminal domain-containing protein n=1 Tax=Scrofimicrobium appendicitidis TaxID=3079930 RepID=A0AAU7V7M2_9ACTO